MDNEILRIINGSRLYGTFTETSDYDYISIYIEPPEIVFSEGHKSSTPLRASQATSPEPGEDDGMGYSLRHFTALALGGNPSVLSVLFAPEKFWTIQSEYGKMLTELAPLFSSMKAAPRFLGYMESQKLRFLGQKKGHIPNRPELVAKYGYDTKYAMQIIRLAMHGLEFFRTGTITSPMSDFNLSILKEIRNGGYGKIGIDHMIESYEIMLDKAIEQSLLPEEPKYKEIYDIVHLIHERYWNAETHKI